MISLSCLLMAAMLAQPEAAPPRTVATPALPARISQPIPVAATKIDLVLIPGSSDGEIRPFYMSTTEIVWEVFDVFVYRLDEEGLPTGQPAGVDAITRPSKPYLPPDRGFGHNGYAAICVSLGTAKEFCRWLSVASGRRYRLPSEAEWEHAARAGATGLYSFGDDASRLGEYAWYSSNADEQPHPVATKKPSPWGLFDMHGNVQEWCVARDGSGVTRGGSYRDDAAGLSLSARQLPQPSWNASDPQVPKSTWWLADGSFVGFRVVCEAPVEAASVPGETPKSQPAIPPTPPMVQPHGDRP